MQHVGQQLEAVDQPRAGPREVRRRVHRDHTAGTDAAQLVGELLGLLQRARGVVAAGHADDDLGLAAATTLPRASARSARPAKPSTSMPPASSISCGVQWPAMKTGSNHSIAADRGPVRVRDRDADARRCAPAGGRRGPARRRARRWRRRRCGCRPSSRRSSSGRARSPSGTRHLLGLLDAPRRRSRRRPGTAPG